jgi:hypothetical protein
MAQTTGMQQGIDICSDCHDVCLQTLTHCLQKGGKHAEAAHIGLLIDCAEICRTSADFMLRGSTLHASTCSACADVCEECAASCERSGLDPEMRNCADTCRRCADSCRQMATRKVA